jgi:hypothetical protein
MAFRTGDRVHQHSYGAGDIIAANADYITINLFALAMCTDATAAS